GSSNHHWWHDQHHAVATAGSGTSTTSGSSSSQSQTGQSNVAQWFNDHPDFARVATTLGEARASTSSAAPGIASTTSNSGAKAYALLNQMMAADFGGTSHFAQAATALSPSPQQASVLTRPLH